MENKILSSGLEDYIEAIYIAQLKGVKIKGAELARKLGISRASVSEAIAKLVSKKLITYKSYGVITLTGLGEKEAKEVYLKHNAIKTFFETVLDVEPELAGENACKIEHIISKSVLDKMIKFTSYCSNHPKIIEDYKKEA